MESNNPDQHGANTDPRRIPDQLWTVPGPSTDSPMFNPCSQLCTVLGPCSPVVIRTWSGMNCVWSGVLRGAPGSPTRNAGSTRIAQDQHGATTDLPGLPRIEKSSRTVRADHSNFKQFKIAGVLFRTMTDHPRLSRISPDPTQIHHRSDSGSAKFQSETLRNSPGGQCDRGFTFTD